MSADLPPNGSEFFHPISVDKIPASGAVRKLDANEQERRKLAARFGIMELPALRAELTLSQVQNGRGIEVKGRMAADVVQKCVVTLEPLPGHIERDIQVLFTFDEPEKNEIDLEPDAVEIEAIRNGAIDLGELVAQNFGIALDPYPRKPGAVLPNTGATADMPASPLAKLAEWKKKPEE